MHSKKLISNIVWACACIFLVVSCSDKTSVKNIEQLTVDVVRIDHELARVDKYEPEIVSQQLLKTYPEFTAMFTNRIINIGDTVEPYFSSNLNSFVTDRVIYELNASVADLFADFSAYQKQLSQALSLYKFYFPEKNIPVIYTYLSGMNQSVVVGEGILGISLDKYLGSGEPLYKKMYPPIPNYQLQLMSPEYVVSDAVRGWVSSDISYEPMKNDFLSRVLHEARTIYITKQMLPELNDTILWGFTDAQLRFCVESESEMWKYLIEQKLLFSTDNMLISKFVDPGPFTKDFTRDSPARAAVWVGYQIVEEFMQRNSDVSLSELTAETDFQKLLNEARYNP